MKLKYSIVSLLALAATLVSCEKEADHYLSEMKVSSSYVSLPKTGGDAEITITAEGPWEFSKTFDVPTGEKDDNGKDITVKKVAPAWLTVTPESGVAGEATIKFHAEAPEARREAVLVISCMGKTQNINIVQDAEAAEKPQLPITPIATVMAEGEGTWRVRGTVTKVVNDQYGNFYMIDDSYNGPDFQIYGTKNEKGQYPKEAAGGWASFGIEAGDIVTVEGPYSLYKTTHELVDVSVIAIEKSLIKVEAVDYGMDGETARTSIPAEGGEISLKVTAKVSPLIVTTDADWLKVTDIKNGDYVLTASANDYTAVRKATVTLKGEGAMATVDVAQDGIPATGATVTDIIAMDDNSEVETLECTTIAKTGKGVVVWDGTTACYVYGDKAADVKVGDNVKVFGIKKTYNGVPEIELSKDNEAHLVKVLSSGNSFEAPAAKDVTAEAGTYTASKAEYIKLTGTLKISGNYYNLTLDEFPEGEHQGSIVAPVEELNVASLADKKITVTGWFNGLSSAGKYINIIATKVVEFVDNPKGSVTNPYTPSEIAAEILGGNIPEEDVYIKGIVSAVLYTASASYPTATFWLSDDGTAYGVSEDKKSTTEPSKDFECYSVKWFGNADWAEGNGQVTVGDEVVVCGKTTSYNGVAETSSKKAWLHSVNYVKTAGVGLGSTEFPFNVAGAEEVIDYQQAEIAAAKAAEAPAPTFRDVCVGGKISAILYTFSASYGTGTFWISDDGTAYGVSADKKSTTEPTKDFECYSVYMFGLENPWVEGTSKQVAVGDDVIVKGQLTKYNTTYETASKKAWIYSLNGATE